MKLVILSTSVSREHKKGTLPYLNVLLARILDVARIVNVNITSYIDIFMQNEEKKTIIVSKSDKLIAKVHGEAENSDIQGITLRDQTD